MRDWFHSSLDLDGGHSAVRLVSLVLEGDAAVLQAARVRRLFPDEAILEQIKGTFTRFASAKAWHSIPPSFSLWSSVDLTASWVNFRELTIRATFKAQISSSATLEWLQYRLRSRSGTFQSPPKMRGKD